MENNNPSSSRSAHARKVIERNRRNQMKALCSKLNSLVPHHQASRDPIPLPLPDQVGEATNYIKSLQVKLEKLKEKKNSLLLRNVRIDRGMMLGLKSPQIETKQVGSALEVVLKTGLDCQFMFFNETIRVVHEEGADVVNANYTVVEDAVFHTIHCQVGESANGAVRISERLKKFLDDSRYI